MSSPNAVGTGRSAGGFSLIELLIAIVCTMIIGGALLAMVVGGNSAFMREPALSDRQQNIRVAMDLIQRDIAIAGAEMEPWVQAFAIGTGVGFQAAPLLNGSGPMGPGGVPSDRLMIIGNSGECPSIPVAADPDGVTIRPQRSTPACYGLPALVFLQGQPAAPTDSLYSIGFACDPSAPRVINFPAGQDRQYNFPGGGRIPDPMQSMVPMQLVAYMIAPENAADPTSPPALWRSPRGGINPGGTCGIGSGDPQFGSGYQLIARGIEDLQVRYTMGPVGGAPVDSPAIVATGNYNTLVRDVEVTLTARALENNLLGAKDPAPAALAAGVPRAVRAQLQSVSTPRAVLLHLANANPRLWQ
jgi:type II secretory pathway pseudopilin PulG